MKTKRPVNLDLTTIQFPITAISSILHRISGVLLFLFIPFLLWVFQTSLASDTQFDTVRAYFSHPVSKFFIWGFLAALIYHILAGIRHLLMDMGIGEDLQSGKFGARLVIWLAVILAIVVGVWLW